MLEDEVYEEEKQTMLIEWVVFKRVLKKFIRDKKIVVIDLNSEYTKYMKKKEKD